MLKSSNVIESLERRTLLAAAQINFADFSDSSHLVENGYVADRVVVDNKLRLTNNQNYQARSVWYDQAMPIERFRSDFSFRVSRNSDGADGLTFAMINGPTSTLGADGRGLGFGNINVPSEAVAFNFFNFGKFGSQMGFASNGERPGTNMKMKQIDLHSGHIFKVTVTFDGSEMKAAIVDATARGKTFVATQNIDLVSVLETTDAIVGFTAGTGANKSQQEILSWSFAGERAVAPAPVPTNPDVVTVATASPNPVHTRTTMLSVLGTDPRDGEAGLTYTWSAIKVPNGAKTPVFSVNGTNDAKSTVARFYKEGNYTFRATLTNKAGRRTSSDVNVRVISTATYVGIDRHKDVVYAGTKSQYRATMYDQFRREMREQPAFDWSVIEGPGTGTINAETGAFQAGNQTGHIVVAATALGLTGTVGATITPR